MRNDVVDDATEQDATLLEAYLDESLSQWEAEHVRARLASDPVLAAELHQLRAERETRSAVWNAIEVETGDAGSFADSVLSRVRTFDRWRRFRRIGFVASAVAACFVAGWVGHILLAARSGSVNPSAVVTRPETGGGSTRLVSTVEGPGAFQVILTDQAGKVLAIQKFTKLDEARQFANELSRFRSQQEHVRQGQMVLISDEF